MDLSGIERIVRHAADALTDRYWEAIANALYSGLYDYEKHAINKGMFRATQPRGQAAYRTYGAPHGRIVGRYMPQDAHARFGNENLLLWDERLEIGLLRRIDTYRMPLEIMDERRARYGREGAK